jgi:hypothetical protein
MFTVQYEAAVVELVSFALHVTLTQLARGVYLASLLMLPEATVGKPSDATLELVKFVELGAVLFA